VAGRKKRKIKVKRMIVRAIDAGYGYVKFTQNMQNLENVGYSKFPSVAVRRSVSKSSLVTEQSENLNTIDVVVNDEVFTVGFDAHLEIANDADPRVLHENYIERTEYMALNYGALHYMNEPNIDILVVGLPVSFLNQKQALIEKLTGVHEIYPGKTVTVKKVNVIPQPMGGLMAYALGQGPEVYERIQKETTLIPDPGYKTFDWVLLNGLKPIKAKSGSHPGGGMREILELMTEDMQQKGVTKGKYKNFEKLDEGLATGVFNLPGKKGYNLTPHIQAAKGIPDECVQKMYAKVGSGDDVDNIIMAGGPSDIFKSSVTEAYPEHEVLISSNSQFANVTGYFLVGVSMAKAVIAQSGEQGIIQ
jgi:plasmid segregation protein ParM